MTYQLVGPLLSELTKISGNTVTAVFSATSTTPIASIVVTENGGTTPTLTVEIYNGTTSYYLRKGIAMTAGTPWTWEIPFLLGAGSSIRVTSGHASGNMDVLVNYVSGSAQTSGRQ